MSRLIATVEDLEADQPTESPLRRIARFLTTLSVFFAVVVSCLLLRENFPFSHFPMYASFGDSTYYVYVADRDDRPVPVKTLASVRTSVLKKIYRSENERQRASRPGTTTEKSRKRELGRTAGEYTLHWLLENSHPEGGLDAYRPLRLYRVDIRAGEGAIHQQRVLIAIGE